LQTPILCDFRNPDIHFSNSTRRMAAMLKAEHIPTRESSFRRDPGTKGVEIVRPKYVDAELAQTINVAAGHR
jgi:hypothetical protein